MKKTRVNFNNKAPKYKELTNLGIDLYELRFIVLIAEGMPYLNLITSLIGAIAGSFIGFIYCAIADLITREKEDCGKFYWRRIVCIFSVVIGLVAFFLGTITSLTEIVKAVKRDLST